MKLTRGFEFPPDKEKILHQAVWWEVGVIVYEISAVALLFLVMGGSQAVWTSMIEDSLAIIPPVVFLLATATREWAPNDRYPYGYHRVVDIAFLVASAALLGVGLLLVYEGVTTLWHQEHPTIGSIRIGGWQIWLGWLMLPVLAYDGIVPAVLGRVLLPKASQIHDKVIYAGAGMLKADWLSASAAAVGVLGIAVGWWWADAVAAIAISISIVGDGFRNMRSVIGDLMDRGPEKIADEGFDLLPQQLEAVLEQLDWVERAEVRLREHGHVFFGEAFVIPRQEADLPRRIEDAVQRAYGVDWRLQDLVIHLVPPGGQRAQPPQVRRER